DMASPVSFVPKGEALQIQKVQCRGCSVSRSADSQGDKINRGNLCVIPFYRVCGIRKYHVQLLWTRGNARVPAGFNFCGKDASRRPITIEACIKSEFPEWLRKWQLSCSSSEGTCVL